MAFGNIEVIINFFKEFPTFIIGLPGMIAVKILSIPKMYLDSINFVFDTIKKYFPELSPFLPSVTWDDLVNIWEWSPPGMYIGVMMQIINDMPSL